MWRFGVYVPLLILVVQVEKIQGQEIQDFFDVGSECGESNVLKNGRINGGTEATPHDWPWQALVKCSAGRTKTFICGGTLISNQWVLTAGHCLLNPKYKASSCIVHLGTHKLKPGLPDENEQRFKIAYKIVHYGYIKNLTILGYDIALIKLEKNVTFSDVIKPICMPFGLPELNEESTCYTTGWGRYNNKAITEGLRQIQMPVKDFAYCRFTGSSRSPVICAGEFNRQENVCNGDSGGPLSCSESDGRWTVRGVVSMVDDKCLEVASYSKVAHFEHWIKEAMSNN